MIWKIFLSLLACHHSHERREPSFGPQTDAELEAARNALQKEHYGVDSLEEISDAGIKRTRFRWPGYPGGGVIPYVIHASMDPHKDLILKAMEQYNTQTCIKFVERKNEETYINLLKDRGCSAPIGMIKEGELPVYLGPGCEYLGTIVHELGHVVGLYHEHQRSDRDKYVTVYEKNITAGETHNFKKTDPSKELIFTKYDYDSIMHYGNYIFSIEPKVLMTMVAKNGHKILEPYDKPGLTSSDIETIKKLYQCN